VNGFEEVGPVIAVLGLLFATLWMFKRRGMVSFSGIRLGTLRDRQREMQCMERMQLTPQHSLHLVRIRDRVLVISVAPSGCTLIQDLGAAEVKAGVPAGGSWS
jgi:flagellar biogenesis protein FliO